MLYHSQLDYYQIITNQNVQKRSFKKMYLKLSPAKVWPTCSGLNLLSYAHRRLIVMWDMWSCVCINQLDPDYMHGGFCFEIWRGPEWVKRCLAHSWYRCILSLKSTNCYFGCIMVGKYTECRMFTQIKEYTLSFNTIYWHWLISW